MDALHDKEPFYYNYITTLKSICHDKPVCLIFILFMFWASAIQADDYKIYPPADKNGVVQLKPSGKGEINLILSKTIQSNDTISILLTSLVGQSTGEEITPEFSITSDTANHTFYQIDGDTVSLLSTGKFSNIANVIADQPVIPIRIYLPEIPAYQSYKGTLLITNDHEEVVSFNLQVNADPGKHATLAIDLQSPTLKFSKAFCNSKINPQFTWHIYEQTGKHPIKGLYAELLEYSSTNGQFNPKQDINFTFNGCCTSDLWGIDEYSIAARTVDIGGQANITATIYDLPPGEYSTKIKFKATNASDEAEASISTLKIKIKDHWLKAFLVIFISILFSYFTSKWLNTRRQKLALRQKIADLNPAWLRMEPYTLGVIKARSTLKLVEDLTDKIFISRSDLIDQKLEEVKVMLKYLHQSRRARKLIESAHLTDMKYRRAMKNYRRINDKIGVDKLDETLGGEIEADLNKLEGWFQPDQFDKCYGDDLMQDVDQLLDEIGDAKEIPATCQPDFNNILQQLQEQRAAYKKKSSKELSDGLENIYAVVKVLWERHNKSKILQQLIKHYLEHQSSKQLLSEVDRLAWSNLKAANTSSQHKLEFISPKQHTLEKPETFQPIWFKVFPQDPAVADNYLFKHGLKYHWNITILPPLKHSKLGRWWEKLWGKTRAIILDNTSESKPQLTPVTDEPKVVQFIPIESRIKYCVNIWYFDKDNGPDHFTVNGDNEDKTLSIVPSSVFSITKSFQNIELMALAAALVAAVISGMLTFYFNNETFGTLSDYLTLFLWGAGIDQTKNFIQNFQSLRKNEPTA